MIRDKLQQRSSTNFPSSVVLRRREMPRRSSRGAPPPAAAVAAALPAAVAAPASARPTRSTGGASSRASGKRPMTPTPRICNPPPEAHENVAGRRLAMNQAWAHTIRQMKKAEREHGHSSLAPTDAVWQPDACSTRVMDQHIRRPNRTLWFFGNSVSRIQFFAVHAILTSQGRQSNGVASNVSLLEQVENCGRGGEWHGKRPGQGTTCHGPCSCSLDVPGHPSLQRLQFVWQQKTFDNTLAQALIGNYSNLPVRAHDIVIINTGLDVALDVLRRSFTHKKTWGVNSIGRLCEFKGNYTYFEGRWRRDLHANARRLAHAMLSAWRVERRVFWRTSTPACYNKSKLSAFDAHSHVNPMLAENDAIVSKILRSLGAPVLDIRGIDLEINGCNTWRAGGVENENHCRCQSYVDHTGLHPGPQLAARQVARLLTATDAQCQLPGGPTIS